MKRIPTLSEREFVYGNIAPDAGEKLPDRYEFTPPKSVSHFLYPEKGHNLSGYRQFYEKYLSCAEAAEYSVREKSFYSGYFCHLLADWRWSSEIAIPLVERDPEAYKKDKVATSAPWKRDWYDLDRKYLRDNDKSFRAYEILRDSEPFLNRYLGFFPENAFIRAREKIVDFYSEPANDLDREYGFINEERAEEFVSSASEEALGYILKII